MLGELTNTFFTLPPTTTPADPMSDSGSTESESDSQEYVMEHTGLTQPVFLTPRSEARCQERLERLRNETPYYKHTIPIHTGLTPESSQHIATQTMPATLAASGSVPKEQDTVEKYDPDAMDESYSKTADACLKMGRAILVIERRELYGNYQGEIISDTDTEERDLKADIDLASSADDELHELRAYGEDDILPPDLVERVKEHHLEKARQKAIRAYNLAKSNFMAAWKAHIEASREHIEAKENYERLYRRLMKLGGYVTELLQNENTE